MNTPILTARELSSLAKSVGRCEERLDVLSFLRAEHLRFARATNEKGLTKAGRKRCAAKASVLSTIVAYIERGDHVGSHERGAGK